MVSNGSVKEFVLITQDEYSFLKHKGQKEDQNLDTREKQKLSRPVYSESRGAPITFRSRPKGGKSDNSTRTIITRSNQFEFKVPRKEKNA